VYHLVYIRAIMAVLDSIREVLAHPALNALGGVERALGAALGIVRVLIRDEPLIGRVPFKSALCLMLWLCSLLALFGVKPLHVSIGGIKGALAVPSVTWPMLFPEGVVDRQDDRLGPEYLMA
jgi:hypothetical protein